MNFGCFVGNQEIKSAISAAFKQGRVPQAIILQGEDGLGKRTLAKIIARAAVCRGENPPCNACPSCTRSLVGSHPDIRIIEGSGISGNISVDTVKGIVEDAYRKPEESDCNVYLLFVKSKLTEPVQNKLLKIIEEPPGNALFIITIASAETLLPTIRSRTQLFTLRQVSSADVAEFIEKSGQALSDDILSNWELYRGNIGRMLNGGAEAAQIASNIANCIDGSDEDALLSAAEAMVKDRSMFAAVLEQLMLIFRDAVVLREGGTTTLGSAVDTSQRLSHAHRKLNLLRLTEICANYGGLAGRNLNMSLLVTAFCAKMRSAISK